MTTEERRELYLRLEMVSIGDHVPHGIFKKLEKDYPVKARRLSQLWKELRAKVRTHYGTSQAPTHVSNRFHEIPIRVFEPDYSGKANGITKKLNRVTILKEVSKVPFNKRRTYESLAHEVKHVASKTTIFNMVQEGAIKVHSSALKPTLSEAQKHERILYCLSMINRPRSIVQAADGNTRHPAFEPAVFMRRPLHFQDQYNTVHVDEKWYHLIEDGTRYLLVDGEAAPDRRVRHKKYIEKIMFLCAVARPRRLSDGTWFDGKLGIWPFGHMGAAKIDSKNRLAGTPEWVNVKIDRDEYRSMMLNNVIPAIIQKFPGFGGRTQPVIRIQQDGAPVHIANDDPTWLEELQALGVDKQIDLYTQPSQSPDLNILDLGIFNAVQARYRQEVPRTKLDIIRCVNKAFNEFPREKLNDIWLTHMNVMNEILLSNGDNDYTLPHMGKGKLKRQGKLPVTIPITEYATEYLVSYEALAAVEDSDSDATLGVDDHLEEDYRTAWI